ncbi:MAG: DUF1508 domain-containing protein [Nitrosospira sp.]|nr:DUF1508 domain-containing protein [Nitrosospira sp.]
MYFQIYQEGQGLISIQWRWRLRAANHEIIASGEGYNNKQDCIHAVNLLKNTNAATPVKEI